MSDKYFFFKGRVALYAILKAMGIKAGNEIILPGFTCVVVPNAIIYLGAKPVYEDIDPKTYNIDPQLIEDKITEKTKVIIAQHTFGIPAEMQHIKKIAEKYGFYVIEDSCHTIGSRYDGREVGTFGDAAFFSSQWSKPVTTGLGGWSVINNEKLLEKMERVYAEFIEPSYKEALLLMCQYLTYSNLLKPSLFWFAQNAYRRFSRLGMAIGSSSRDELECKMPRGYAKKMAVWQKELLNKKLSAIKGDIRHRKRVVSVYEKQLQDIGIEPIKLPHNYEPVFLRYPVWVNNKKKCLEEAKEKHVELGDWFLSPVHPNVGGWERVGYKKGTCPDAERTCEHLINLPTHERTGSNEIEKVMRLVEGFLKT